MIERHEGACDFERWFPQGLLCDLDGIPEGLGCLYLITNLINDKIYVGQTWWGPKQRWYEHVYCSRHGRRGRLYSAMRKNGIESFTIGLLGVAQTQEELDSLESLWIVLLNSKDKKCGYNIKDGGRGGKHSESTKRKVGKASKKMWEDAEMRRKITEGMASAWSTPERIEARRLLSSDPELRKRISQANIAVWADPERGPERRKFFSDPAYQEKVSSFMLSFWGDPGNKERMLEAFARRYANPEERLKISQQMKTQWDDIGYRKRISEARSLTWSDPVYRGTWEIRWNDPEFKKKQAIAAKKAWESPEYRAKQKETRDRKKKEREDDSKLV